MEMSPDILNPRSIKALTVSYDQSEPGKTAKIKTHDGFLKEVHAIRLKNVENEFNDFLRQPLLPHKISQEGPGIAVGDINNDGIEDIFILVALSHLPAHFITQGSVWKF